MQGFFNLSQSTFAPNTITVTLANMDQTAGSPGGPLSDPYCQTSACNVAGKYTNPFPFTLPFKSTQVFPNQIEVNEYDPSGNFRVPVTYDYNLTIEQQFLPTGPCGWPMSVPDRATCLSIWKSTPPSTQPPTRALDGHVLTFPGGTSAANARRVYNTAPTVGPCLTTTGCNENYSQIVEAAMIGNAHYNSLQATLQKRMSHGLQLLANYTWSKSYDDMPQATRDSNTEDLNAGESYVYPLYPSNATNIPAAALVPDIKALDRGLSDIDHPQAFSVSYEWAPDEDQQRLPCPPTPSSTTGGPPVPFQSHSGDALTVWTGTDNSDTGLIQDRGQRNFSLPAYLKSKMTMSAIAPQHPKLCENWLNPAAFSVPLNTGAGTGYRQHRQGFTPRSPLHGLERRPGPHLPVFRESNLEFRMDYFDVLNHTILNNPGVSSPLSSSTSFGTSQVRTAPDRVSGSSHSSSTSDALQLTGTKGGGHFPPPFLFVLVD